MDSLRVAWVMPICCVYWQVVLRDFVKLFPQTKIFTSKLYLSTWELEKALEIEVVSKLRTIKIKPKKNSYGSKFSYMSPSIIIKMLRYQPNIIFVDTFCLWSLLILLFKPWVKWKVILAYEGSSPGVDYRYSTSRLFVRRLMVKIADACITNTQIGKAYLTNILYACEDKVFNYSYLVPDSQLLVNQLDKIAVEPLKTMYQQKISQKLIRTKLSSKEFRLQKPVFLFIGHIIPRKGIKLLLEACVILKKKQCNFSLLIVGEGQQQAELEKFCCFNELNELVKWVGKVDYHLIGSYFDKADILILPSLEDTWGMVVLEAILFGKVVLCSSCAGASEIITEYNNGFVFEPQNPNKLAQLMETLINNPHLITLMKQKSRQIRANYTPESSAKFFNQVVDFVADTVDSVSIEA